MEILTLVPRSLGQPGKNHNIPASHKTGFFMKIVKHIIYNNNATNYFLSNINYTKMY